MNSLGIPTAIMLAALTPSTLFEKPSCDYGVPASTTSGISVNSLPNSRLLSEDEKRGCSIRLTPLLSDGVNHTPIEEVYTTIPHRVVVLVKLPGKNVSWACVDGEMVEEK